MTREKENERIGRRVFLHRGGALLGGTAIAATLVACGGSEEEPAALSCTENVTAGQQTARQAAGYVEQGTDPAKLCKDCNFYPNPPPMDSCGNCTLNLGAVNPMGSCNSWVARQ